MAAGGTREVVLVTRAPAFQFYAGDWLRDPALRACSLAARGLWIDLLAYMHQAEPYGHLCVNGQPVSPAIAARLVGETERRVVALLAELEAAGVFSRREDGAIYSRRMVRDERVRRKRAAGGKLGGNPNLRNAQKVGEKVNLPPNLGPTPAFAVCSLQSAYPPETLSPPEPDQRDWPSPVATFRQRFEGRHDDRPPTPDRPDNSAPARVRRAQAERAERERAAATGGAVIEHDTGQPAA